MDAARFEAHLVNLHALLKNLANLLRTLATPSKIQTWSLISLRAQLINADTRLARHPRCAVCQFTNAALHRSIFAGILAVINGLRESPVEATSE